MISKFTGNYEGLSNFADSPLVLYDTVLKEYVTYKTVEHYFQAMKTINEDERRRIINAETPGKAKKFGRQCKLRYDWEFIKCNVMRRALEEKFSDSNFEELLMSTGNEELVEGNYWHDNYWGNCNCDKCKDIEGKNNLGKLLMKLREAKVSY